ncbi:MAG: response regulator [Sedimentisphaerales bacterium]|nr:response regulator [Sedimentisphaerales bacterium]MBN2841758.1 response regulator [Sedimentisphaerales bacterium]
MKPVILCVDDDISVLRSLEGLINETFGGMCHLEIAQSGQEALEIVESILAVKQDIALVITDYSMPDMNGDELVCKLCNRLPLATMALMTGFNDADIIARTVNAGRLDRFISKPWDNNELTTIIFDILKMYMLKKELNKKNTELTLASEMARIGMVRINYQAGLIQLSDEWFTVFGYNKENVKLDFNFYESLFCPEDRYTLARIRKDSLEGNSANSYCSEMKMKDAAGNWRYIKRCISAVEFDEHGHPIEYLGIDQDLTDQKYREKLLAQAQEKSEILDNLAEQVTFLTTDMKVIWTNRIPQGCTTTQKSGYICYEQWYGLDKPCTGCVVQKALTTGQKCTTEIARNGRVDSMIAIPIKNEQNTVIGIIVSQTDITEQKQIEMRLAHAQQMESIGSLAAGIAHEINTPIQYIGDNLTYLSKAFTRVNENCQQLISELKGLNYEDEILIKSLESSVTNLEMVPDAISDALAGVDHVSKIIVAMKDFSHPSIDNYGQVDLNQAINNAITISRNEWKYIAELTTDFQEDQLIIDAVPNSISQVLLNLIINSAHAIAEKYGTDGRDKGTISIHTYHSDNYAILEVKDDGCGIKDSIKSRIFDPFFTSKDVGKGTGQGLAIAYDIVSKKHNGSIDFESTEGQGTTFTVRLPLERAKNTELSANSDLIATI